VTICDVLYLCVFKREEIFPSQSFFIMIATSVSVRAIGISLTIPTNVRALAFVPGGEKKKRKTKKKRKKKDQQPDKF